MTTDVSPSPVACYFLSLILILPHGGGLRYSSSLPQYTINHLLKTRTTLETVKFSQVYVPTGESTLHSKATAYSVPISNHTFLIQNIIQKVLMLFS